MHSGLRYDQQHGMFVTVCSVYGQVLAAASFEMQSPGRVEG